MPMFGFQLAPWSFFPWKTTQGANLTTWHPGSAGPLAARQAGHLAVWVGWLGAGGTERDGSQRSLALPAGQQRARMSRSASGLAPCGFFRREKPQSARCAHLAPCGPLSMAYRCLASGPLSPIFHRWMS
jgi:hypothetical protein